MKKINMDIEEAKRVARNFKLLAIASAVTVIAGSVVMHHLEGWGWVDSIYFSFVSLTTVGYGDLSPTTDAGKIFVIFYLLTGIGIIAALLNNMFRGVAARRMIRENKESKKLF